MTTGETEERRPRRVLEGPRLTEDDTRQTDVETAEPFAQPPYVMAAQ